MNQLELSRDANDIVSEVRMERQVHKGSFLLLEGNTDIKRMTPYLHRDSSTVNCCGHQNLLGAVQILNHAGFEGFVSIADADFGRVTGQLANFANLIYSEHHDLDIDWCSAQIVHRYLLEYADEGKCSSIEEAELLSDKIRAGLKPLSVAKLMSVKGTIPYSVSRVNTHEVFTPYKVNTKALVSKILGDIRSKEIAENLFNIIEYESSNYYDLDQITNGHDFHCALAVCLRSELAQRSATLSNGPEVERHIRLTHSIEDFEGTYVARELQVWEHFNAPFKVRL